jgi:N-methylhydantoinase A
MKMANADLNKTYYVGIDIGGTFTDMVLMDQDGNIKTGKASTTPGELEKGVFVGLQILADEVGLALNDFLAHVRRIGVGTTQVTNALIERKGIKTGLITTRGFADTIFIQRLMGFTAEIPGDRLGWYSKRREPDPVVPRSLVCEVTERIDRDGRVAARLDEIDARRAVKELIALGVESFAVCLLWSFRNDQHERRIREIIREIVGPNAVVSISSEVNPLMGEYERTATTVLNSYLGPSTKRYFDFVQKSLADRGFRGTLTVLNSSGGVLPVQEAGDRAVELLLSGPSGGVTASRYVAETVKHNRIITADMGGTSFDVSLVVDGRPLIKPVNEVNGYHLSVPVIDIRAIGAGGGSIVTVEGGRIRVGPESAGANPGPVCYRRGGMRPTTTDADLVLGILDPDNFLGGRMKLDLDGANASIEEHVARPLGISVEEAAAGIRQIVDSQMADTIREITIGRGHDPREFVIYAYGGAGPAHCASFARELGVREIFIPATSMVHSAYGALASDVLYSEERSLTIHGDSSGKSFDVAKAEAMFREIEKRCRDMLGKSGFSESQIALKRFVGLRYMLQTHSLLVQMSEREVNEHSMMALAERFHEAYEDTYGKGAGFSTAGIEIDNIRVEASGRTQKPTIAKILQTKALTPPKKRKIFDVMQNKHLETDVYQWPDLVPNQLVNGPAVIEHPTTTVYFEASQTAKLDEFGNLIIRTKDTAK